jgi:hypothetical protein
LLWQRFSFAPPVELRTAANTQKKGHTKRLQRSNTQTHKQDFARHQKENIAQEEPHLRLQLLVLLKKITICIHCLFSWKPRDMATLNNRCKEGSSAMARARKHTHSNKRRCIAVYAREHAIRWSSYLTAN